MRSQFLLDLSDSTCTKPNIHAASRDLRPLVLTPLPFRLPISKGLRGRFSCAFPITRLPDHPMLNAVNPESKELTRFNPGSTPGLTVVNPGSTHALSGSTPGLGHQPRHLDQKYQCRTRKVPLRLLFQHYSKEKANCQGKNGG